MVIDDEIGPIEQAAEVVRLDVDGRDPVEARERRGRDLLDVDVQHVGHPQVFRPRHPLHRPDDRRRLGAAQQVAQREAAGERIRIRVVMEEDEDAVGVGEVALVLLDPRPGHRAAELGDQAGPQQLRQLEMGDVAVAVHPDVGPGLAGVQDVDERAAGVADRVEDLLDAAFAGIFDEEAGGGSDVGLEICVDAPRIAGRDLDPGVMETPGERPAFDKEVNLEARQQYFVERPDDQFILTNGQNAQIRSRQGRGPALRRHPVAEARQTPSIRLLTGRAGGDPPGRRRRRPGPGGVGSGPAAPCVACQSLSVTAAQIPSLPERLAGTRVFVRLAPLPRRSRDAAEAGGAVPADWPAALEDLRRRGATAGLHVTGVPQEDDPVLAADANTLVVEVAEGDPDRLAFDLKRALSLVRGRHPAETLLIAASPDVSAALRERGTGLVRRRLRAAPRRHQLRRRTFWSPGPHIWRLPGDEAVARAIAAAAADLQAWLPDGLVPVAGRALQCGEDRPLGALLNPRTLDLVAVSRSCPAPAVVTSDVPGATAERMDVGPVSVFRVRVNGARSLCRRRRRVRGARADHRRDHRAPPGGGGAPGGGGRHVDRAPVRSR